MSASAFTRRSPARSTRITAPAAKLPVIRRQVGGGAVYLDRNQMFFHFIYPRDKAPQYAANLYPLFCEPAVRTYRDFGVAAEYRPINDIQVAGRKIGGTGAASIGEATVMVGSFMFDFDTATMARCLKVPSEKFRDKLKTTLDDYMTTMTRELATVPSRDDVKARFLKHCAAVLGVTAGRRPADGGGGEGDRRTGGGPLRSASGPAGRAASSSIWA